MRRIRPVSAKRQREALGRAAIRSAVFERDGWRCVLARLAARSGRRIPPCYGALTFGHIQKASQGGRYTEANGLTQCERHQVWLEDQAALAHELGLVVRHGETHEDAAERRKAAGI